MSSAVLGPGNSKILCPQTSSNFARERFPDQVTGGWAWCTIYDGSTREGLWQCEEGRLLEEVPVTWRMNSRENSSRPRPRGEYYKGMEAREGLVYSGSCKSFSKNGLRVQKSEKQSWAGRHPSHQWWQHKGLCLSICLLLRMAGWEGTSLLLASVSLGEPSTSITLQVSLLLTQSCSEAGSSAQFLLYPVYSNPYDLLLATLWKESLHKGQWHSWKSSTKI